MGKMWTGNGHEETFWEDGNVLDLDWGEWSHWYIHVYGSSNWTLQSVQFK